jgi:Mg-chelatase subunit ChlD
MTNRFSASLRAALAVGATAMSAACAAGGPSAFTPGDGSGSSASLGAEGDASTNQIGIVSRDASGDALANGACAESVTETKISPALLVFMFDRSGSMSDSVGNGLTKWTALVPALESFFADPKSAGISASLQFFAQPSECVVSDYATPLVAMTALPESSLFSNAIGATSPTGDTPTLPALQGALQYASQVQAQNPGARAAVVLVTDGEPHDSCGSTVADVAMAAATADTAAPAIPTYVVGIGKSLTSLDTIAKSGGTGQAFLVATANNPDAGGTASQTETEFESALGAIRSSQATCNLPIPAAPTGQSLDFGKVNVLLTAAGGSDSTLSYSADCGADGGPTDGWHYDDLQAPTAIVLCPSSCNTVQVDVTAKLDVELGCKTQGIPPR